MLVANKRSEDISRLTEMSKARQKVRLVKGPWIYEYGFLEDILSSVRNWGKGLKLTRQAWDRYTMVDPTYPLRYCVVSNFKRNNWKPKVPRYFLSFYKGENQLLPAVETEYRKGDWRILRDDDLVLAMSRECIRQWEERQAEEKQDEDTPGEV